MYVCVCAYATTEPLAEGKSCILHSPRQLQAGEGGRHRRTKACLNSVVLVGNQNAASTTVESRTGIVCSVSGLWFLDSDHYDDDTDYYYDDYDDCSIIPPASSASSDKDRGSFGVLLMFDQMSVPIVCLVVVVGGLVVVVVVAVVVVGGVAGGVGG